MMNFAVALCFLVGYAHSYPPSYYYPEYYSAYNAVGSQYRQIPNMAAYSQYLVGGRPSRIASPDPAAYVPGDTVSVGHNCEGCADPQVQVQSGGYPWPEHGPPTSFEVPSRERKPTAPTAVETFSTHDAESPIEIQEEDNSVIPGRPTPAERELVTEKSSPQTAGPVEEDPTTRKPSLKRKTPKKEVAKRIDEEEQEVEESPFGRNPYNMFFPIYFGGYPGARGGSGGGAPSGPTAIANSFSTGRGGVATSHATAYGGAPPKSSYRE